ncbi:hypothetical protein PENTCL1PPCAC_21383, partial [Pristionchus entomophagus]
SSKPSKTGSEAEKLRREKGKAATERCRSKKKKELEDVLDKVSKLRENNKLDAEELARKNALLVEAEIQTHDLEQFMFTHECLVSEMQRKLLLPAIYIPISPVADTFSDRVVSEDLYDEKEPTTHNPECKRGRPRVRPLDAEETAEERYWKRKQGQFNDALKVVKELEMTSNDLKIKLRQAEARMENIEQQNRQYEMYILNHECLTPEKQRWELFNGTGRWNTLARDGHHFPGIVDFLNGPKTMSEHEDYAPNHLRESDRTDQEVASISSRSNNQHTYQSTTSTLDWIVNIIETKDTGLTPVEGHCTPLLNEGWPLGIILRQQQLKLQITPGALLDVLKKTIWLVARGEPFAGQVAVAYVIINRARANRHYFGGDTIAEVCLHPWQFSWNGRIPEQTHCEGDGYEYMDSWVRDVIEGRATDPTGGALYFNNPDVDGYPDWTRNVRRR